MEKEESFIDELIKEAEENEEKQTAAYYDLLLLEIEKLQNQIADNFSEAEKEKKIIDEWALRKNSMLQGRIIWLERKLEAYIREEKLKTIELAHGVLRFHKRPQKIEIENLELFLKNAKPELLTVIPESIRPDLNKIKAFIKSRPVPLGVKIIEGNEEFSYKLKNLKEVNTNGGTQEAGIRNQQADAIRAAI